MDNSNILNRHRFSILAAVLAFILSVSAPAAAFASEPDSNAGSSASAAEASDAEPFHYQHDPMENPDAAKDIIVNPDAVYGYSPSPDSVRLSQFVDALDWTDKDQVAAARQERAEYLEDMKSLYKIIEDMLAEGKNVEEIARAVSKRRNEIRLESYDGDPDGLEKVKKSNLDTYGNEEGPTPDQLYEKYGSWQTVIEKALSSNPGMDACLGFYDENYDMYDISDRLDPQPESSENETGPQQEASSDFSDEASVGSSDEASSGSSVESSAGSPRTYTVKKGDCLWNIASSELGDGSRWTEIYELNKDKIDNPRLIYAGQEFVLPAA